MLAAVAQEPRLFTGSVGDTAAYGLRESGDDDDRAARELRLAEAIADSHVGQQARRCPTAWTRWSGTTVTI